ncbi:MAG: dihydroneopterin aldolase [Betaproteobacteria bacterium]|nr:dihydroneopterin aldolase [Betaproteobacteria bacterium]
MDIIFIRDIRLETLIGAYESERRQARTLQVNIEIGRASIRACKTDKLADTIDYSAVVGVVKDAFASHRFHLLEPLAEMLAGRILEKFDAQWARIEVSKSGIVPNARDVGVRIERSR